MADNHLTAVALEAVSRKPGSQHALSAEYGQSPLNGNADSLSVLAIMSPIIVSSLVGLRRSLVRASG